MTHPTIPTLHARHGAEERELVHRAIRDCHGSLSAMAVWLGVHQATVQRLIERHGLRAEYDLASPGPGRPRVVRDPAA